MFIDYGRGSEKLKEVCDNICRIIKKKLDNDAIEHVWPARKLKSDKVVFVIESKKEIRIKNKIQSDLELVLHHRDITYETESHIVMAKERECLEQKTECFDDFKRLQKCLTKHSNDLMNKHKNITAIMPSVVKSVSYGSSGKHTLLEMLCISVYVERKVSGLIPLDAEPISTMVECFPTDIIQGECRFFGDGPDEYHANLKIGLAIHADVKNENGHTLGGTLGCFLQHEKYELCCITNAHVVLSRDELHNLFECNYTDYGYDQGKPVYQPLSKKSMPFGRVVAAACKEGQTDMPGVEVALIKILNRQPQSGSFPQTASEKVSKFTYNSGSVIDATLLKLGTDVFKCGMETGQTVGKIKTSSAPARFNEGIKLHNQIVIIPDANEPFAREGDSGAPVFIDFRSPGRESVIGLITGGFPNGYVYVTPIYEILKSLKCKPFLQRFENSDDSGVCVSMPLQ
ncbi:uncharacterized protein LOC132725928, partial [Ruditapes philippinarum]|uniref:uncharacterized protein LOC132725928 n=1 Tax=Ruditapes philippinarum TaxID=129788 RepID=UPI00295B1BD5